MNVNGVTKLQGAVNIILYFTIYVPQVKAVIWMHGNIDRTEARPKRSYLIPNQKLGMPVLSRFLCPRDTGQPLSLKQDVINWIFF